MNKATRIARGQQARTNTARNPDVLVPRTMPRRAKRALVRSERNRIRREPDQ